MGLATHLSQRDNYDDDSYMGDRSFVVIGKGERISSSGIYLQASIVDEYIHPPPVKFSTRRTYSCILHAGGGDWTLAILVDGESAHLNSLSVAAAPLVCNSINWTQFKCHHTDRRRQQSSTQEPKDDDDGGWRRRGVRLCLKTE